MIAPDAGGRCRQSNNDWTGGIRFACKISDDTDSELILSAWCVAEARRIVARQRDRILKLKALGSATPDHELTLQAFVGTLADLESHAQKLAETAKWFQRPRRMMS